MKKNSTIHARRLSRFLATLLLAALVVPVHVALAQEKSLPTDAQATYADIEKTLGLVPSFMRAFPPEAIGAAWDEFKGVQLNPASAISPKYKELIGLAVAAQIPCRYCIYFHSKVAGGLDGASDRELTEAVVMASITRQWSTVLNGLQTDEPQFRAELAKIIDFVKRPHAPQAAIAVTDAPSAYRDMEATLGLVPWFFKQFPVLNGTLTDEATFRHETDQAIANVRKKMQVASSR
jgi:AhpD family alkylhydroperoxidase